MQPNPPGAVSATLNTVVTDQQVKVTSANGDALRKAQGAAPGNPLDTLDVPQALAWIDANVTDLNSLRAVLKAVTALIIIQRADFERSTSAKLAK